MPLLSEAELRQFDRAAALLQERVQRYGKQAAEESDQREVDRRNREGVPRASQRNGKDAHADCANWSKSELDLVTR